MRSVPVSIIGGRPSLPIPWQVHIHITRENEEDWCGGTILDERTILSAAHCFENGDKAIVEAGFTNHKQIHPVKKIIKHHDFNERSYDSDIAILKL